MDEFRAALALNPEYSLALHDLGIALAEVGRFPEAVESLEHAVRLEPNNGQLHNDLGVALRT